MKHMPNSTKEITMVTDFMITYPLNHPGGYIVSILLDIMVHVHLLRIPIATSLHQQ